jgi:hypothetical protein
MTGVYAGQMGALDGECVFVSMLDVFGLQLLG